MAPAEFLRFLHTTASLRPRVYRDVWGSLSPREVGRWGAGIVREMWRAR
jgi:lycopene cyclase CruA